MSTRPPRTVSPTPAVRPHQNTSSDLKTTDCLSQRPPSRSLLRRALEVGQVGGAPFAAGATVGPGQLLARARSELPGHAGDHHPGLVAQPAAQPQRALV